MKEGLKVLRAIAIATPLAAVAIHVVPTELQTLFTQQSAEITSTTPESVVLVAQSYDHYDQSTSRLYMTKADLDFVKTAYVMISKGREPDKFTAYVESEFSFPNGSRGGGGAGSFSWSMDQLARAARRFNPHRTPYKDFVATYAPNGEAKTISIVNDLPALTQSLQIECRVVASKSTRHFVSCGNPRYRTSVTERHDNLPRLAVAVIPAP